MKTVRELDVPTTIVFIDDAHTFGGAQIALAWAVRAIVRNTTYSVLCICTEKTKETIVRIVGPQECNVRFAICPPALPLSIVSFPLRLIPFLKLLLPLRRQGVTLWWLNLAGLESCLAATIVLKTLRAHHAAWLHCTEAMSILVPGPSRFRRVLSRIRDRIAEQLLIRLHPVLATPSKAASEILRRRTHSASAMPHLYPTVGTPDPLSPIETSSDKITLWMIGRIQFGQKNNQAAVDTLRALKSRGVAACLNIVGDGPDREELLTNCSDLITADEVRFLGWTSTPWSNVAAGDIVLIPSFWEGMPLTAIEAMLRGIRIVTSPLPMFYEGVPEDFIATGSSGERLADRVEEVLALSREEVSRRYCASLHKFNPQTFIEVFRDLTSELTSTMVARLNLARPPYWKSINRWGSQQPSSDTTKTTKIRSSSYE